jgi:hemerythrin
MGKIFNKSNLLNGGNKHDDYGKMMEMLKDLMQRFAKCLEDFEKWSRDMEYPFKDSG